MGIYEELQARGLVKQVTNEPEIREALDLVFSDHFSRNEPGIFEPIRQTLLKGDYYMHLADLTAYAQAQQAAQLLLKLCLWPAAQSIWSGVRLELMPSGTALRAARMLGVVQTTSPMSPS